MLKVSGLRHLARLLLNLFTAEKVRTDRAGDNRVAKTSSIMNLLEAGIKAESIRQRAIASNIANLETPGYRRVDVNFEELFAKALDSRGAIDLSVIEPQLYRPRQTPVKANGNDVNLESEVGEMIKNSLRHKTFIRLLSKRYKQMEMAINVGR